MGKKRRASIVPALATLLVSCGSGAQGTDRSDGSVAPRLPDGGGSGSIAGMVQGKPFDTVGTAYWIGAPDSAATTVVYVFSGSVGCEDLQAPGWDGRIADGSQILEMKLFGTTAPASFSVTMSPTPAPGEATVNSTVASTTSTPSEVLASGGMVTLSSIAPGTHADGTFQLTYAGGGSLMGSFQAIFCPGGHEP